MGKIDLTPKTNREILLMVAEQSNDTREGIIGIKSQLISLNGTVRQHDRAIAKIQGALEVTQPSVMMSKPKQAGILTALLAVVSLVSCAVQSFGRSMGWW